MKIETDIVTVQGRIRVRLDATKFTALEETLIIQFGDPLVEIGGTITGTKSVPGWAPTTITLVPQNPDVIIPAYAVALLDQATGAIMSVVVEDSGEGYTAPPLVQVVGDGEGAVLTATIGVDPDTQADIVTSVVVDAGGQGYHNVPWTGTYQIPTAQRRLKADFPVQRTFDMADFADAEAMALIWAETISNRMIQAITELRRLQARVDGETAITV